MHLGLALLVPVLVCQVPVQPAAAAGASPGALVRFAVQVQGAAPAVMSYGLDGSQGLIVYALSPEGRPGVAAVIGGYGRSAGAEGKAGLSVLFFVHFYADGKAFLEAQILNDAIEDAPGFVTASYEVTFQGGVIAQGTAEFADQTGIGVLGGTLRYAPRNDLLERYAAQLPDPKSLSGIGRQDAEKSSDPDPVKGTHQTGSPRNRYVAVQAAKYLFTQDERYLARLMDFVLAQAWRPYHLSEKTGEPFLHEKHPEAVMFEGRPVLKPNLETFGRMLMSPAQSRASDRNGWDHEHMNVEELYAAYVLCGSRVARRDLVLIAEELLSTPYVREEGKHQHSARAFGWVARMLVRAYQATGEARYLAAVRRMMASLRAYWRPDGPFPFLVAQEPRNDHMPDQRFESPFMVAVAASAIALYVREKPDDAEALKLLEFCGDLLVDQGYSAEKGGFYYDYSVESSKKTGDGSATSGVVLFIASPLVEVAELLPPEKREKYLAPARRIYTANRQEEWGKPGSQEFFRWFLRAAKEFE
ncbi:MAG: hypothetical protein HY812_15880 [Planctomycetes bacterium]|nr:hypothetical protein [Planctomycetota bacterium]